MPKSILEIKNISFSYGSNKVLDNVSFVVKKGGYLGIVGPNGGGKSTLLKIILGLLQPDLGEIKINGNSVSRALDLCRIGYVSQRISQNYYDLPATVYEIVESGLASKEILFKKNKDHSRKIRQAIEVAGLKGLENKLLGQLSGGQRQRVFVARALSVDPQILILDEPFVGIDVSAQDEFYKFLKKLNRDNDLTIVFVSHDIDIISSQAEEIIALNQKVVYSGRAETLDEDKLIENIYAKKFTHIHHS